MSLTLNFIKQPHSLQVAIVGLNLGQSLQISYLACATDFSTNSIILPRIQLLLIPFRQNLE
jgi:hypothetical protein